MVNQMPKSFPDYVINVFCLCKTVYISKCLVWNIQLILSPILPYVNYFLTFLSLNLLLLEFSGLQQEGKMPCVFWGKNEVGAQPVTP